MFVATLGSGTNEGTLVTANRSYENGNNGYMFAGFNDGRVTATVRDNVSRDNMLNGIEYNCGLNIPPPEPDAEEPPLPPIGLPICTFTVVNNSVTGNRGQGGLGPVEIGGGGGSGISALSFNGAVHTIDLERNRINHNGSSEAFAGIGMLGFNNASVHASMRKNTLADNDAAPAVNVQTLLAVPPEAPVPGHSPMLCLDLNENISDTGYLINRADGTDLRADTTMNKGLFLMPSLSVPGLNGCFVPDGS
jgi:hypothetical protein